MQGESTSARRTVFTGAGILALLTLSACGPTTARNGPAPEAAAGPTLAAYVPADSDDYKIGKPYKVAGKWYTPKEDPGYDRTGRASWYGRRFHGRRTANGEVFDMAALTGAHPTLPLPSYARVTNLDNGNSVVVRLNDRGPYAHGRVIDVSARAAEVLGFKNAGAADVRVQFVGLAPPDRDDAFLASTAQIGDRDDQFAVATLEGDGQAEPAASTPAGFGFGASPDGTAPSTVPVPQPPKLAWITGYAPVAAADPVAETFSLFEAAARPGDRAFGG